MASCSYSTLVEGLCASSLHNPADIECVTIGTCKKNIQMHLQMYGVSDSSLDSEARLLLARAGIFDNDESSLGFTICPRHREMFGIRWRCNKKTCVCPSEWAGHKSVKADRGLTLQQSKKLYQETQVLIPVASPVCRQCRRKLDKQQDQGTSTLITSSEEIDPRLSQTDGQESPSDEKSDMSVQCKDNGTDTLKGDVSGSDGNEQLTIEQNEESTESDMDELSKAMMNLSLDDYVPEQTTSNSSTENSNGFHGFHRKNSLSEKRMKLNEFLSCYDAATRIGPYKKKWEDASVRTKKSHVSKAKDFVVSGLNVIAPGDAGHVWEALKSSNSVEKALHS